MPPGAISAEAQPAIPAALGSAVRMISGATVSALAGPFARRGESPVTRNTLAAASLSVRTTPEFALATLSSPATFAEPKDKAAHSPTKTGCSAALG